jgi:hypothetical protein
MWTELRNLLSEREIFASRKVIRLLDRVDVKEIEAKESRLLMRQWK